MHIEAIIWDIDGTLVDSEPLHLRALLAVCAEYGVDISELPDDEFIGVNLFDVWDRLRERYPADLTCSQWMDRIDHHYENGACTLAKISGATETILTLHDMGLRQAAVSNSDRTVVDVNLAVLGIDDILEFSLSLDDVPEGKPSPVPYAMALAKLILPPQATIAVEDSQSGARSAEAAGIDVAALANRNLQAKWHIPRLNEIPGIVRQARVANV